MNVFLLCLPCKELKWIIGLQSWTSLVEPISLCLMDDMGIASTERECMGAPLSDERSVSLHFPCPPMQV